LTNDRFGIQNSTYSFDGVDDFIEIHHSEILNLTNSYSISAWFYPELVSGGENQEIIGKWHSTNVFDHNYRLGITKTWWGAPPHRCIFSMTETSNKEGPFVISSDEVSLKQWNHVVAIYNSSQLAIYLNGSFQASIKFPATPLLIWGK